MVRDHMGREIPGEKKDRCPGNPPGGGGCGPGNSLGEGGCGPGNPLGEGGCGPEYRVWETHCPRETWEVGRSLGRQAQKGQIYCLDGDLGTGKTIFAQGFAAGLEITEPVNSPTFTILQQYEGGRLPLYHFDVYRISDVSEMDEIGYEDCFYGDGVCLMEWSLLVPEILPDQVIRVGIEKDLEQGFDYRRITVEGLDGEHGNG